MVSERGRDHQESETDGRSRPVRLKNADRDSGTTVPIGI
jgi:hypothetical protein